MTHPLEVVFLTNYSEFCFQAIPAVAQMADDIALRLTILHTVCADASPAGRTQAQARIESFFPEADSFAQTTRRVMTGTPMDAVRRLQLEGAVDLLLAPAADRLGFPRLGHRSRRGRLLRENTLPLWSIGRATESLRMQRRPRNIACWVDFENDCTSHVSNALSYARLSGARLHLLCALPDLAEGMLLLHNEPATPSAAATEIARRLSWLDRLPEIHVAPSPDRKAQLRLLQDCDADLLFVLDSWRRLPRFLAPKPMLMDESPCPVIWIPADTGVSWQLAAAESIEWQAREPVAFRNRGATITPLLRYS